MGVVGWSLDATAAAVDDVPPAARAADQAAVGRRPLLLDDDDDLRTDDVAVRPPPKNKPPAVRGQHLQSPADQSTAPTDDGRGRCSGMRIYEAVSGRLFKTAAADPAVGASGFAINCCFRTSPDAQCQLAPPGIKRLEDEWDATVCTIDLAAADAAGFNGVLFPLRLAEQTEDGSASASGGGGFELQPLRLLSQATLSRSVHCLFEPASGQVYDGAWMRLDHLCSTEEGLQVARDLRFVSDGQVSDGPGSLCLVDERGGGVVEPSDLSLADLWGPHAGALKAWQAAVAERRKREAGGA